MLPLPTLSQQEQDLFRKIESHCHKATLLLTVSATSVALDAIGMHPLGGASGYAKMVSAGLITCFVAEIAKLTQAISLQRIHRR